MFVYWCFLVFLRMQSFNELNYVPKGKIEISENEIKRIEVYEVTFYINGVEQLSRYVKYVKKKGIKRQIENFNRLYVFRYTIEDIA